MPHRSVIGSFLVIVIVAFLLRFVTLNQSGYWYDEILSLKNSALPWPEMRVSLRYSESNKPPLYYLLMHQWLKVGGDSETWVRLPSAFFGALTCGIFFLLGYRLLGTWAGWAMAGYLTVSPMHLAYSQEARMYVLFEFVASAALLCLILYFQQKKTGYLVFFGLLSVLVNYTFTYGFFFLGFSGLLLLAQWNKLGTPRALAVLATLVLSFVLFIPWLREMIQVSNAPEGIQFYKGPPWAALIYTFFAFGYGFDLGPTMNDLQNMGSRYFLVHPEQTALVIVAMTVLLILTVRGLWSLRSDLFLFTLGLSGLGIFLLSPALISLIKPTITDNPRYAFLALIPFSLILATGALTLWRDGRFGRATVILYGAFLALAVFHFYDDATYQREDLRKACRYVAEQEIQPQALVVCAKNLAMVVDHYYHGPAPLLGFTIENPKAFSDDAKQLGQQLDPVGRFALIYSRPDHGDPARQLLPWLKSRYVLLQQKSWPGMDAYFFSTHPPDKVSPP